MAELHGQPTQRRDYKTDEIETITNRGKEAAIGAKRQPSDDNDGKRSPYLPSSDSHDDVDSKKSGTAPHTYIPLLTYLPFSALPLSRSLPRNPDRRSLNTLHDHA